MLGARAALVLFVLTPPAVADRVITPTEELQRVRVCGYSTGDVHVCLNDGSTRAIPLVEVKRLVVDSLGRSSDFNEAERLWHENQAPEAIVYYERALRRASDGQWPPIIRIRLVQACDAAGRFESAVTHLLAVIAESPLAAARLLPASIPASATGPTRRVLRRIAEQLNKTSDADGRALLRMLHYAIVLQCQDDRARADAHEIARLRLSSAIGTKPVYALKVAAIRSLFGTGDRVGTLRAVNRALGDCPREVIPDLLAVKGEALMADAQSPDDLLRAGLVFMRIPIHFADHPRAPEALWQTARVYERIGRTDKAEQLLSECRAHPRIDFELRSRVDDELERLAQGN